MIKVIYVLISWMDIVIWFDGYTGFCSGTARAGLSAALRGAALLGGFGLC